MSIAPNDLDPTIKSALSLLHSQQSDSAEKMRNIIDDIIKQRHGSSKMLVNTLSKKFLAEEVTSKGSGCPVTKKPKREIERKDSHPEPVAQMEITQTIDLDDESEGALIMADVDPDPEADDYTTIIDDDDDDDADQLKELEDLMCVVCQQMDVSARNRLIECTDCHSLYHQECHTPAITDTEATEQEYSWTCSTCKKSKEIKFLLSSGATASPTKSSCSSSSSSSSSSSCSSSSVRKTHSSSSTTTTSKLAVPNSSKKSSSSSYSSRSKSSTHSSRDKESSSKKSSSHSTSQVTSPCVTPNIKIISADKRLQNMKKKAAKLHEGKRSKHSK